MAEETKSFETKFVDQVGGFYADGTLVKVLFRLHAAEYSLPQSTPDFVMTLTYLTESWRTSTRVEVTVVGTKILSARPAP